MNASVVSCGFATVDVLLGSPLQVAAGGTAVNVAMALASFGWNTSFVGTIGQDPAGDFLEAELNNAGVETSRLQQNPAWLTPIVLQDNVNGDHVWRFRCPECNTAYAKHRPGPASVAEAIIQQVEAPSVFFFDRATLYAITLAEAWAKEGTLVVFEPAGLGRPQLFERAVRAASLIKYSSERSCGFAEVLAEVNKPQVETLGRSGVRFRPTRDARWSTVDAFQVEVVDSAGAGDWTTAALLHALESNGEPLKGITDISTLSAAVEEGQRMGARACTWRGVRPKQPELLPGDNLELFACPRVLRQELVLR